MPNTTQRKDYVPIDTHPHRAVTKRAVRLHTRPGTGKLTMLAGMVLSFTLFFLASCQASFTPAPQATAPAVATPTAEPKPSATQPASGAEAVAGSPAPNPDDPLNRALEHLQTVSSFQMTAHETLAYQGAAPDGTIVTVYSERIAEHAVIRQPVFKVHTCLQTRSDPQAEFTVVNTYSYPEGGRYYVIDVIESGLASKNEVNFEDIEPLNGDVYQTLIRYAAQAEFVSEQNGEAIYTLDHPAWYALKETLAFPEMEFLAIQENSAQAVQAYAVETYPDAAPIRFTIHVDIEEQVITKVTIDRRDFMLSIWQAMDQTAPAQEEQNEPLTRRQVLDATRSEYLFSQYARVRDFQVPTVPT